MIACKCYTAKELNVRKENRYHLTSAIILYSRQYQLVALILIAVRRSMNMCFNICVYEAVLCLLINES